MSQRDIEKTQAAKSVVQKQSRSVEPNLPSTSTSTTSAAIDSSLSVSSNLSSRLSDEIRDDVMLLFLSKAHFPYSLLPIPEQLLKCTVKVDQHFGEISLCVEYIRKASKKTRIFVITLSVEEGQQLLVVSNKCPWLKGVYVLEQASSNAMSSDIRIHCFDNWNSLMEQLNADAMFWRRQLLAFRFFKQSQKTMRDVTTEAASFMWSQILLDVLKDIPSSEQTTKDMLDMCADYYRDNTAQLALIEEFRCTYRPYEAIRWYTRDTFLYRRLNEALRTEDIDALILFRPFIVDLCRQIEDEQRVHPFSTPTITVYHGQRMTMEEIEKLRSNQGNLVSTNAFWSSSLEKEVAIMYAGEGQHDSNRWSVLVQIDVDTRLKSIVLARIDELSFMQDEREVIFSLSAVFRIINVNKDRENNRWCVYLEATDEGRDNFREYGCLLRNDIEETNIHVVFGRLIMGMGKYAKACSYFSKLPDRLPTDDVDLQAAIRQSHGRALFFLSKYQESFDIISEGLVLYKSADLSSESPGYLRLEFNVANIYMFTGRFNDALELYEKVLNIQQKVLQPNHRHIADSLCGISWAYQRKQNYKLALDYCSRALDIFQCILPPNHPSIFKVLAAFGGMLGMSGQWDLAYDELKRSLDTCRRFLPHDHTFIGNLLQYVGTIHANKGELDTAFDYYQQALTILQSSFPGCHMITADLLTVIADLHRCRKEFSQAIELHERSEEMRLQFWPSEKQISKHYLALVYLDMGDTTKAIELFELTYKILMERSGVVCAGTCRTLSCLATAYSHQGDLELSHKIFAEVLDMQRKCFPEGHPDVGVTLHHMGSNFRRMKSYERAMGCYKNSVDTLEGFMHANHPDIILIKQKIQQLVRIQQN